MEELEFRIGKRDGTVVMDEVLNDMPAESLAIRHHGGYLVARQVPPSLLPVLVNAPRAIRVMADLLMMLRKGYTAGGSGNGAVAEAEEILRACATAPGMPQ